MSDSDSLVSFPSSDENYSSSSDESENPEVEVQAYEVLNPDEVLETIDCDVENNKNIARCPGTNCDLAFRALNFTDDYKVQCSKGHQSCFLCKNAWHDPVSCDQLKKWFEKEQDTSVMDKWLSERWIAANTKKCPKCDAPTMKEGGGDNLKCSQCGQNWYWNFFKKRSFPGSCFEEEPVFGLHECKTPEEAAQENYLKYFLMYEQHQINLNIENETFLESIYKRLEKKSAEDDEVEKENRYFTLTKTLTKKNSIKIALEALRQGRNTLMYSYIFSYFLKDSTIKTTFEDNLKILQQKVEELCDFLVRDIEKISKNEKLRDLDYRAQFCKEQSAKTISSVKENDWEFLDM